MKCRRDFLVASAASVTGALLLPSLGRAEVGSIPIPMRSLNNGRRIPSLGFGTYKSIDEATASVQTALSHGYRLIDTAAFYKNEAQVGEGIALSGVPRGEIFLSSKLWLTDYGYDSAMRAFDTSLAKLQTDYLDLYFLHYPSPRDFPPTIAAYKAMEKLLADGRVRAIAVSNFREEDLDRLKAETGVVPAINQIEIHPYFPQRELRAANARRGIVTQAWSPIGGIFINHPKDPQHPIRLLDDPVIASIAQHNGRTPAQVVLRWHIQNGVAVIPKSIHPDRIASNLKVFDFKLADADMAALNGLDRNLRGGGDPATFDRQYLIERERKAHS